MKAIVKPIKHILLMAMYLYVAAPAIAQTKQLAVANERKDFYQLLKQANIKFTLPGGFREIKAVDNEDFTFDYAMEIPGNGFEVWVQVKSQKQNWASYKNTQNDKKNELANPDSMYLAISMADAIILTGGHNFLARNMPPEVLARYNADAGKSYLLNLPYLPETRHYKYALLMALQKNHTGILVAVYFTNQKDAEFYRDVNRAAGSIKFLSPTDN